MTLKYSPAFSPKLHTPLVVTYWNYSLMSSWLLKFSHQKPNLVLFPPNCFYNALLINDTPTYTINQA